jgi:hypothetical protein
MGTSKTRQEKFLWFPFHIHNRYGLKQDMSKDIIIAEFCVKFFSSRKIALEILHSLIDTNKIIEKDNKLYVFDDYEQMINSQFNNTQQLTTND